MENIPEVKIINDEDKWKEKLLQREEVLDLLKTAIDSGSKVQLDILDSNNRSITRTVLPKRIEGSNLWFMRNDIETKLELFRIKKVQIYLED